MMQWKRDVLYGVAIIVFCAFNYAYSLTLSEGTLKYKLAHPGVYLRLMLILFALLGLLLIVKALINKPSEKLEPIFHKMAVFAVIAMCVFVMAMPHLGFRLASVIFCIVTVLVFSYNAGKFHTADGRWKDRKEIIKLLALYIFVSVIIALTTHYVFQNILGVRLPKFKLF